MLHSGKPIAAVGLPDEFLIDAQADAAASGLTFIARVPIHRADGSIVGVALAYDQQSKVRASFRTATNRLSITLCSTFAIAPGDLFIGFMVACKCEGKSANTQVFWLNLFSSLIYVSAPDSRNIWRQTSQRASSTWPGWWSCWWTPVISNTSTTPKDTRSATGS